MSQREVGRIRTDDGAVVDVLVLDSGDVGVRLGVAERHCGGPIHWLGPGLPLHTGQAARLADLLEEAASSEGQSG